MVELFKTILSGQNAFASGGLLLMIIGGIGVYLRAMPVRLWEWLVDQTTMMITVNDDDVAFAWIKEWFLDQEFLRRIRRVDLDTTVRNERVAMVPAPGCHCFWYAGRPFWVWFTRTENTRERSQRRLESLTFRTVGRDREFLQRLVDDVVQSHTRRMGVQSHLYIYDDGWGYVEGYAPRVLDSVILQAGEKEQLVQDIIGFRQSRQRYARLGIPYHRGYLFYGPPGTGKTSLVSALAAHFGMPVYAINLADFSDRSLVRAVNDIPGNSVLLFEDIDCAKSSQSRGEAENTERFREGQKTANGVTLAGVLNVLDGFYAPANVLFVMTTNHIEALDDALLRPGRIDYQLYLGQATVDQKIELYRRFFPNASEFEASSFVQMCRSDQTMAEFQGFLLKLEQEQITWEGGEVALPFLR